MDGFFEQNKDLIIMFVVALIVVLPIALLLAKAKRQPEAVKKAKREKRLERLYNAYTKTPFLKNYTKKCYYQIRKIAASGEHETRMFTATTVTKGLLFAFITGAIGTLFLENPISICISWGAAFVMLTHVLRMETNKLNKKLLMNFAPYVGLLREEYMRTDSIPESFGSAETPTCLQVSTSRIKDILESSDTEYELNRFIQETQCSYIRTLAMAAIKVNDRGDDTDTDKQSESVFVRALKYIEEDSYSELERLELLDSKFSNNGLLGKIGGLPVLCLFPMLGTRVVPKVMLGIMSMLQAWYGGLIGQIVNVAICAVSLIGFAVTSKLMSHEGVPIDDRKTWVRKLLKIPFIAKVANMAAPKKDKKHKLEKILNDASSMRTVLDISCERLVTAFAVFFIGIVACIAATIYQKQYFRETTQSFSLMANDDLKGFTSDEILAADDAFIEMLTEKAEGNKLLTAAELYTDDETAAFAKSKFPGLGDVQISDQVSRMRKKYDYINGAYFKYQMILFCLAFAVLGFLYPEFDLKKNRLAQVRIEERDDFMQLQTLCTILASANCDVMETLDELSKLTKLYKRRMLSCYLNYATNPEKELERLSSKVKLGNFKHLIKKISLAVDQLTMKEAFEGMDIERNHVLSERKMENQKNCDDKRSKANLFVKISMFTCLINTLLMPIMVVGITSLTDMLGQMQSAM